MTQAALGSRPEKRQAILDGALKIFSRDGYSRASIDAIADEARVSTRTIYNHFSDKAGLFQDVIRLSATRLADAQVAVMHSYFRNVTDLEEDLTDFANAWLTPLPDHEEHFALVGQVRVEAQHIPDAAIEEWQASGPRRVKRELGSQLQKLAVRGELEITDPELAAQQFVALVSLSGRSLDTFGTSEQSTGDLVRAGVRTFLHGHVSR